MIDVRSNCSFVLVTGVDDGSLYFLEWTDALRWLVDR